MLAGPLCPRRRAGHSDELSAFTSGFVAIVEKSDVVVGHAGSGLPVGTSSERMVPIIVAGKGLGHLVLRANATRSNPLDDIYVRQVAEIAGIEMLERQTRQEPRSGLAQTWWSSFWMRPRAGGRGARFSGWGYARGNAPPLVPSPCGPPQTPILGCINVARDVLFAPSATARTASRPLRGYLLVFCAFPRCMAERRVRGGCRTPWPTAPAQTAWPRKAVWWKESPGCARPGEAASPLNSATHRRPPEPLLL